MGELRPGRGTRKVSLLTTRQLGGLMRRRLDRCIRQRTAKRRRCVVSCLSFFGFGTIPVGKDMRFSGMIFKHFCF